ncbi:MAG TPA: type II CAAX endopeptidase family protein [Halobacteriales archaeon]|nr:type II CAAX endopeptidase family protein [Halobacteriales archaeon]
MATSPATAGHGPGRRAGVALLLTVAGVVAAVLLSLPVLVVPLGPLELFVAATVLSELGFAAVAVAFVVATGAGLRYLNLHRLNRRAALFVVGGTVGMFVYRLVGILVVQLLGLPVAGNAITEFPGLDVGTIVLLLVPISIVVVGPAEELLFRGVIQRYLEGGFTRTWAILGTGVLFSLVHLPTTFLADPNPAAVATTLVLLFGLSLVLSYLYAWTGNLVVPILAHGLYDALLFALAYLVIEVQKLPTVLAVG